MFVPEAVAQRVEESGRRLGKSPRVTIRRMLEEFKDTVEAEAVNSFWRSRAKKKMKSRPEKLAQEILAVFISAKLGGRGTPIREAKSGTGFVDMIVTLSSGLLHVIELKMLKGSAVPGPAQLQTYMKHKKREEGWLVLFDTRTWNKKKPVIAVIRKGTGTIRTVVIDINPLAPSKRLDNH